MIVAKKKFNQVDVLLINPPSPDGFIYIRDTNRHGRSSWERIRWPQTSLAYLAAIANKKGYTVELIDCIAQDIAWAEFEKILQQCRPKICLSNVISVTYSNDIKALRRVKEISGAITIGMGPHLTNDPKEALLQNGSLDFVFTHETEATFMEFLEEYKHKLSNHFVERLQNVKGIAFIPNRITMGYSDEPLITEQRPFIHDLDLLPWPMHNLLPLSKYWAPFLGNYTFVEASRGCIFRCVFCRQAVMWQWRYRSRAGKNIAEEAIYVSKLGVDNILFHADTFTIDHSMVEELCDTLISYGSPFKWACNAHVKTLLGKKNLLKKMKKAGCWMIAVGIESGDDNVLTMIKKNINVAQVESVVKMIDEVGIEAWGYFVLGLPGDTKQTMRKTIRLAMKLPLSMAKFDIAAPYPGTEFYRYAREHNYLRADNYEYFDQNACAIVEYPHLSRKEIQLAVRRATRRFYLRPHMLMRLLREMKDWNMLITIIKILYDHFRLLRHLKRKRDDV